MERNKEFLCYNCKCDMTDVGKFTMKAKNGRFRIVMQKITPTIYSCPKCQNMRIIKKLFKPKTKPWQVAKKLRRKQAQRVEQLRMIHQKASSFFGC